MLKLFDTLTGQLIEVRPLKDGEVRMSTCGPSAQDEVDINQLRSYLMADWIRRTLEAQGLSVIRATDFGTARFAGQQLPHRDEDEEGNEEEAAAGPDENTMSDEASEPDVEGHKAEEEKLNIAPSHHPLSAPEDVDEVVNLVQRLIERGNAYDVEGNVYLDASKSPNYGVLTRNARKRGVKSVAGDEGDQLKRDPRDAALWTSAEPGSQTAWSSPWGDGIPSPDIECLAASIKALGRPFDILTGAVDDIFPHHERLVTQGEGLTGKPVATIWVHGERLTAYGLKMATRNGNSFTLSDIEARGFDPVALRYLCLTARYSNPLNFTLTSLKAAQHALLRLRNRVWEWGRAANEPSDGDQAVIEGWRAAFLERANDNLNFPGALVLTTQVVHSDLADDTKLRVLLEFDRILGLGLDRMSSDYREPDGVADLVRRRADLRQTEEYAEADALRGDFKGDGSVVEDHLKVKVAPNGTRVRQKSQWEMRTEPWRGVSSSGEVAFLAEQADTFDFTIGVVACNYIDDVSRCIQSALRWAEGRTAEVVVVNNGSTDGTGEWLAGIASKDRRVRVIHTDHVLGEGTAKNMVLRQSLGKTIVLLDTSVEVRGDIFGPIDDALSDAGVGVTGPYGLRTDDLREFEDADTDVSDVHAMRKYCMAFRRSRLGDVGLMREGFRHYQDLALDYSLQFKDKGYRIVALPDLRLRRHDHRPWSEFSEEKREELSRRNHRRFLKKWGGRTDLLVASQPVEAVSEE